MRETVKAERIEDWPTFSKWLRGLSEEELYNLLVLVLANRFDEDDYLWDLVENYRNLKQKKEV